MKEAISQFGKLVRAMSQLSGIDDKFEMELEMLEAAIRNAGHDGCVRNAIEAVAGAHAMNGRSRRRPAANLRLEAEVASAKAVKETFAIFGKLVRLMHQIGVKQHVEDQLESIERGIRAAGIDAGF
jgi:hypothetical protein